MGMIERRRSLAAIGALLVMPLLASAQKRRGALQGPARIGLIHDYTDDLLSLLKAALQASGLQEGRDYVLVSSGVGYSESATEGARRLVEAKVDLIFVNDTAHALAAQKATDRIPIVMWFSGYPVEAGIAESMVRPGKNVTGMSLYASTGIWGKLLELLVETKSEIRRVSALWGYVPPAFPRAEIEPCYAELRDGARTLGLSLSIEEVPNPSHVSAGIEVVDRSSPDALLITAGPGIWDERERILRYAVHRRIPTVSDFHWPGPNSARQPLITYGGSISEAMHRAARYAARILFEGAKPADLPIQQPAKFDLVVDMRMARAIGLIVPQSILLRADRVIE